MSAATVLIAHLALAILATHIWNVTNMDTKIDSSELTELPSENRELEANYRSISKAAIASVVFALLGLVFLVASILIILPVIALGLSLVGLSNIKKYPEELIGYKAAKFGLVLSGLVLVGGLGWHYYVYSTEVPEGYERISYRMLKDDKDTPLPYSEKATNLDGTKVFLKGFVRPGAKKKNLQKFILVGDFGSCCFGGAPEITDVVAVNILGEERVHYGLRVRKIAGTFKLNKRTAPTAEKEVPKVFYQIDADQVK